MKIPPFISCEKLKEIIFTIKTSLRKNMNTLYNVSGSNVHSKSILWTSTDGDILTDVMTRRMGEMWVCTNTETKTTPSRSCDTLCGSYLHKMLLT